MTISMGVASRAHRVVAGFMIALAAVFVVLAAPASAQTWPSRPIKLIVPHAPGGVA